MQKKLVHQHYGAFVLVLLFFEQTLQILESLNPFTIS